MYNRKFDTKHLVEALRRFSRARVLVLGDVMLDRFLWGRVERISPEAPVPVVDVESETYMLGGAANVVHNLIALGATASICGVVGEDDEGASVLKLLDDLEVPTDGIVTCQDRPTTVKTRVVAHSQQVVRVDRENRKSAPAEGIEKLCAYLDRRLPESDAVIISDYAKGVINRPVVEHLKKLTAAAGKPWAVDPKVVNMPLYAGATVVTPNHLEAAAAAGIGADEPGYVDQAGRKLMQQFGFGAVLITQGERGMTLFTGPQESQRTYIPTAARQVFDVTGAGDTVISTLTLGMVAGLDLAEAALLANFAAGVVVGEVGTSAVTSGRLSHAVREGARLLGLED